MTNSVSVGAALVALAHALDGAGWLTRGAIAIRIMAGAYERTMAGDPSARAPIA